MKRLIALTVALAAGFAATAQPVQVVASTAWTAAMARAGGAQDIVIIAPFELQHPAEYELKPSDLAAASGARLVVHGGYEKFAKRLLETSGGAAAEALQLYTDNVPAVFKAEARKVADKLGTLPAYEAWAVSFDALVADMKSKVLAAYPDRRVVAHRFLTAYAEDLGFQVVGTFGPGEPSPAVVLDLVRLKPALVIDNWHNPSGAPVAEALKAPYAVLINFPGKDGTRTIEDVFSYNERAFLAAAGKR